ncbi:MAG: hypothetical protein WCD67_19450, partial [Xanthobacteraceae bacterium]
SACADDGAAALINPAIAIARAMANTRFIAPPNFERVMAGLVPVIHALFVDLLMPSPGCAGQARA